MKKLRLPFLLLISFAHLPGLFCVDDGSPVGQSASATMRIACIDDRVIELSAEGLLLPATLRHGGWSGPLEKAQQQETFFLTFEEVTFAYVYENPEVNHRSELLIFTPLHTFQIRADLFKDLATFKQLVAGLEQHHVKLYDASDANQVPPSIEGEGKPIKLKRKPRTSTVCASFIISLLSAILFVDSFLLYQKKEENPSRPEARTLKHPCAFYCFSYLFALSVALWVYSIFVLLFPESYAICFDNLIVLKEYDKIGEYPGARKSSKKQKGYKFKLLFFGERGLTPKTEKRQIS